jgi:integron integrase
MDNKPLLEQARDKIRAKHYSIRTEEAYLQWMRRFILFNRKRHPRELGAKEVEGFLSYLAVKRNVSASTQNQAKSALLFLYKDVLSMELPWMTDIVSAKRPTRLPVVLTKSEVATLLPHITGTTGLIVQLLYGTGMRIMECLRLRVKDIDFERSEIVVREGKGAKDRVTILPKKLVAPLQEHLARVRLLHEQDLRDGYGEVYMPFALARKYPNAGNAWPWAAPALPCARGIRTSMCSTICISRRAHVQGPAF